MPLSELRRPAVLDGTSWWFQGDLEDHQKVGLEWLLATPRALLADDVGLGKTIQVLALLAQLAEDRDPCLHTPVLWLTDPSLVDQTKSEIEKFLAGFTVLASTDPEYRTTRKAAKARAEQFHHGIPDILVANYQQTLAKASLMRFEEFAHPGVVVLDEAMALKGGGKMHRATRDFTVDAQRVVAMTATPLENHAYETYMVLDLLQPPGLWPRAVFEDQFIEWEYYRGQAPKPAELRHGRVPEFKRYLEGVMLRRTVEELGLPLPRKVRDGYRRVPLSRAQSLAYHQVRRHRGGLSRKAQRDQIALCHDGHSSLLDSCIAEIEKRQEKVVVYCERIQMLEFLADRLSSAGMGFRVIHGDTDDPGRTEALAAFHTDPQVRVLVGSRILERGLNLQHCRVLISLVQSYVPAREAQREGRIRRIGSPHDTYEHIVLEPDVVDADHRTAILATKARRAASALPSAS